LSYPKQVLEKAVNLRDPLRKIYLTLYEIGKPSTAQEVAEKLGEARAYVHMRLLQLADMGLVQAVKEGKKKLFEVKSL